MKILSLFDGMSVAQQALKELDIPVTKYYASEIDKYAVATTQANHPKTVQLGSVVGLTLDDDIDLLIGGSPCQDLSIAKKNREGLKGQRSGLFYEYVRIRDEVKPKYFILENVASMPKEAKEQISEILGVQPVMINASLVSAQNRKRLFWVGKRVDIEDIDNNHMVGEYRQVEISQPKDRGILLKDVLEENVDEKYYVIGDWKVKKNPVDSNTHGAAVRKQVNDYRGIEIRKDQKSNALNTIENHKLVRIGSLNSGGQGDRIYSEQGKSVSLSANGGGRGAKTGLYAIDKSIKNFRNADEKSVAMTATMWKGYGNDGVTTVANENTQIRKLTPTECLRLQSMPDDYFDKAYTTRGKSEKQYPISNTQRYKMCGNAFNCEVVKHIISQLDI